MAITAQLEDQSLLSRLLKPVFPKPHQPGWRNVHACASICIHDLRVRHKDTLKAVEEDIRFSTCVDEVSKLHHLQALQGRHVWLSQMSRVTDSKGIHVTAVKCTFSSSYLCAGVCIAQMHFIIILSVCWRVYRTIDP